MKSLRMRRLGSVLCWFVGVLSTSSVMAQTVTPEDEYKKLIKVNEEIQPLGETPFGENINLFNGSLSFEQTDISLPGTGPLIQVTRSYHLREGKESNSVDGAFSDWDIEVPRLTTMTAQQTNVTGWQMLATGNTEARCTLFRAPPTVAGNQGNADWEPRSWWSGYQMIVPGHGSQDLLARDSSNTLAPQMPGQTFNIVTKQNWMIGCLPSTDGSGTGEAFYAIAPDGTKYWFDHLVYRWAPNMSRASGSSPMSLQAMSAGTGIQPMVALDDFLHRRAGYLMVTRVEDRFGNYVTYAYNGANLTSITGSDGRQVSFTYDGSAQRISSASITTSGGASRTWNYQYNGDKYHTLSKVTLPDASAWSISFASFLDSDLDPAGGTCSTPATLSTTPWTGTITHPSGLTGTFQVKGLVRGRTNVLKQCVAGPGGSTEVPGAYAQIPRFYYQLAIQQKTFTGAGLGTPKVWTYGYSPANYSWISECTSNCDTTQWTDVTNPDNSTTHSVFSNAYDASEGQLIRSDAYSGAVGSTLLRSEINAYAPANTGPWPASYGSDLQARTNRGAVESVSPLSQKQILQDGDTYTWQAEAFDGYGAVTRVKRFNSVAGQSPIEEQTTYLYDLPHWVLGLPQQTDNLTTGETVSKTEYDSNTVTPMARYRFGQKLMSYAFNAQGQLASFTDANTRTTTLGNYKRGIPQSIGYPDTTSQSLVVDDFGQITSITDQAGSTTSYAYDSIGRLASITYPSGDEQNWLPKSFSYSFVTSAERGLAANHWKRTVTRGDSHSDTYFDAYLRPVLSDSVLSGAVVSSAETRYDWKGQKIYQSYPSATAGNVNGYNGGVSTQYDALGRATAAIQTSELGNLTSTTTYLSGARKQVTDPKGYVTTTSYQVFDAPSLDTVIAVQAPEGVNQTITRDLYGNPTAIRQWGTGGGATVDVTKKLYYDALHRLCRTYEPESKSELTAYDAANNVLWTASGQTIDLASNACEQDKVAEAAKTYRSYDAMNRVLTLAPPSGTAGTSYSYDALGNVQTANLSDGTTWTGVRNKLGLLTAEQQGVVGNGINVISYAHDVYGNVRTVSYPDATVVDYNPDALGRPRQAGSYASGVQYYPDGDVKAFTFGNGTLYSVDKNARQLLSNFSYGTATPVLSKDYVYDANGNITAITDLLDSSHSKTMTYDQLNRLSSATSGLWNGTESYSYDPINNIRSRITGGQTFAYNYDATNRLAAITQGGGNFMTLGYDDRGNVINKNGHNLVFNDKNQLTSITGFGNYNYDASGRRVLKAKPDGSKTFYFYTQAGQLLYALDTGTAKATSYIYLGKKMIARNESVQLAAPLAISFDANPNNGSYTVSWTAAPAATSYTLEESSNGGSSWSTLSSTLTASSFAINNKEGGTYRYRVTACAGTQCVGPTVSADLGVTPSLPGISVPTLTNVTFNVSWTAPISTTAFDVQEQINGGAWTTIVSNTSTTQLNRTVAGSGSYKYQVQAKNGYGTRGWVTSSTVTVDTAYGVVPVAPATLTVPATSYDGNAAISWASVANVTRYVLQQSSNGGINWSTAYDGAGTSTTLSNLATGTYAYQVQACNTYNCSIWKAGSNLVVTRPPGAAPSLTAPASSTNGAYTISWATVATATSYNLQESINGGAWTQVQANGTTTWAASGKTNGSYAYRAQACNVGGCSAWSATGTTTVLLPPVTPSGVTAPATANGPFTVTWNVSPTATSYDVYQSYNNGTWARIASVATNAVAVTPATSGNYQFFITANNACGWSGQTGASNVVVVTFPPTGTPIPYGIGLSALTSTTGSYGVGWNAIALAATYQVQEQFNGGAAVIVQDSSSLTFNTSGRANGVYDYHVRACNAGGCGPWSDHLAVTVLKIPATPDQPYVSRTGTTQKPIVNVSWAAVDGATSYKMELWYPGASVASDTFSNITTTSWSQLILASGTVKFRVQACNATGCSGWSAFGAIALQSGDFLLNSGGGDGDVSSGSDTASEG